MTIQSEIFIFLKNEIKLSDRSYLVHNDLITQKADEPSSIKSWKNSYNGETAT